MLSPLKTLPGIYAGPVGGTDEQPRRWAMPVAIFEAGWDADALLPLHRLVYVDAELSAAPRFLLPEAHPWERGRVLETWR